MKLPDHIVEATRMTRLGRLGEATQMLLRGGAGVEPVSPEPHIPSPRRLTGRTVPAKAGRFERRNHRSIHGARPYRLYLPSTLAPGMPLVVMLHGCKQSPEDFATGTRMNAVAEEAGVIVCYPAQSGSANPAKCWNWFASEHQERERGEPAIIAGITREVAAEFGVDQRRIFVAGLSAGGAAAAVLGAVYPELYAAVGVHSGLACGAAKDMSSAFTAMRQGGAALTPSVAGLLVPTIVFHGDSDSTVAAINGEQVIVRAMAGEELVNATRSGRTADGVAYTQDVYSRADGPAVLERWVIHGGGHAWSGGDSDGSYADARGPDASREMIRFFLSRTVA